jgi:tripartite-type tricarboxylate transporter receptor subunit TctC
VSRHPLIAVVLAALVGVACAVGRAYGADEDYPNRPVKIIVPFAPGGSTDVVARILAERLGAELKQNFVVDNRAGAGGNIGADAVAKATADGYTLLMGTTGVLAINKHLYKNLAYDPDRDLAPVIYTSLITNILVVNPDVPARTVPELIRLAQSKPGGLTFASSGAGSSTHLSGELFKSMASVDILHIPYRGSSQALVDVIGGQVTMLFDNAPSSIPFIEQGKLRAIAVTGTKRLANLPDVPTIDESGVKGYESLSWSGIVAPAGTPKPVIDRLNAAIERILGMEDVRKRFATLGVEPVGGPPEAFARHVRAESEKWGRLVRAAAIRLD